MKHIGALWIFILAIIRPSYPAPIHVQADNCGLEAGKFFADGNVRIESGKYTLSADSASGDEATGEIIASGGIQFTSPLGMLSSQCITYNLESEKFTAQGDVRLSYYVEELPEILLTADSIHGDANTGEVEALGEILFRSNNRTLTGKSITYNYKQQTGIAVGARAEVDGVHFRGDEITLEPNRYVVRDAIFTTCDKEAPHFHLSAREIIVSPGKRISARKVGLHFLNQTLLSVPGYTSKLDSKGKSKLDMPSIGISGRYGAYLTHSVDFSKQADTTTSLELRLSSKRSIQAGLFFNRSSNTPIYARASYREPSYRGTQPDLMLSRLPEIGLRFGTAEALTNYADTHEPLDITTELANPLRKLKSNNRPKLIGDIGIGRFEESPNRVSSGRLDVRTLACIDSIRLDQQTTVSIGLSARHSIYEGHRRYSALGTKLGVARKLGSRSYISLAWVSYSVHGQTPFEFDRIEMPKELTGICALPAGKLSVELWARYDIEGKRIFDSSISVSKRFHCLEPRVTWRDRSQEFSFGLSLVNIED